MILPDFHLKYFLFEQKLTKILTTQIVSFFFDHTVHDISTNKRVRSDWSSHRTSKICKIKNPARRPLLLILCILPWS
eukprot:UN02372